MQTVKPVQTIWREADDTNTVLEMPLAISKPHRRIREGDRHSRDVKRGILRASSCEMNRSVLVVQTSVGGQYQTSNT